MDLNQRFEKRLAQIVAGLNGESDRSKVIILSGHIDVILEEIVKAFLVPSPQSTDPLFEGPNAIFASMSNKIDLAYRLGLISQNAAKALHLIRKIRNTFAHSIDACSLESNDVSSRMKELSRLTDYSAFSGKLPKEIDTDASARFFFTLVMIVASLENCAVSTKHRSPLVEDFPFKIASG